jgi:hypothetical protein
VSVFVVLALALLVMAVAGALVTVLQLRRAIAGLRAAADGALARLAPLREELQSEAAVSALELAELRASVERLQAARQARHHQGYRAGPLAYTSDGGPVRSQSGDAHEHRTA